MYLSRHELDGESLYMVATRTDGSDNYMELFGADGRPLASGEAMENEPRRWDAVFGASRARVVYDCKGAHIGRVPDPIQSCDA